LSNRAPPHRLPSNPPGDRLPPQKLNFSLFLL
jgi:hypothetical protein